MGFLGILPVKMIYKTYYQMRKAARWKVTSWKEQIRLKINPETMDVITVKELENIQIDPATL